MRRTPALIVGGGPAGAAAAIRLAQQRRPHLLVERSHETGNALCGGFMSWRTLDRLIALGVDPDDLNPLRLDHVALFCGDRIARAPLPRPALAVSRHRLDTLMLARAIACGAAVERGVTVRDIDGTTARLADGAALHGDALFLASGKSDIRGLGRPESARGDDPTLGLRVYLGPAPALSRLIGSAVELHLFDRGYAGIAMQEDGQANLCMAVHRSRLQDAGSPARLLAILGNELPALGERLAYMATDARVDAVANVPYGWRATEGQDRLFRLGDQAGVIPSLAGEGMGIAIASGMAAADAYHHGGADAAARWQVAFGRSLRRPIAIAGMVRNMAEGRLAPLMLPVTRSAPSLVRMIARATRVGG